MIKKVFYEVYPKRALHEPLEDLVLMDRTTNRKKGIVSARKWGGCLAKIEAEVIQKFPLVRRVISHEIIFVHKRPIVANDERDKITTRKLKGKIRSKSLYKGFRR